MPETAITANRANWDERADIHADSRMYDVAGLLADRAQISPVVRNDLSVLAPHLPESGVRDLSLLHLQCHIGTDTVSWARLGATAVHGLDFSPNSLRHAARIAEADGQPITWVEGDARYASALIDRSFDLVVTSAGTIVWLPELTAWAQSIHDLLEPGGRFLIRDDHPILGAMAFQPWEISDDYLAGGGTRTYDDAGTYTDPTGHDVRTVSTAADQVTLLRAAMRVPAFAEIIGTRRPGRTLSSAAYTLVGRYGIVAGKSGYSGAAGGTHVFAARKRTGNATTLIVGAVLGQRPGALAALAAARGLVLTAQNALTAAPLAPAGSPVAELDDGLGGRTQLRAAAPVTMVGWPGLTVPVRAAGDPPRHAESGTCIGSVVAGAAQTPLVLAGPLREPSIVKRLLRLN